ncbi:uncharacterized protein LOC130689730 [Daphnia carinata]|uniref:uncharacterized protein LOC130689730 n=1 Tax=Daphnia carinata TaxID=120202 RepID=UPI00257E943F|nr:uncharacterized protein LOC130689730 [Daphnia carinata]
MKIALMFLISMLVVGTHPYFHAQLREMPWFSPHAPRPFIDTYQPFIVYLSKPDSPTLYSSEDLAAEMLQQDGRVFQGHADSEPEFQENYNAADSQPRVKSSLEEAKPRFFFGLQQATFTNPFYKTATFTVSSTITVSSLVRCIPAANFANVAARVTPCRRKRNLPESLETAESPVAIAPSEPLLTAASSPTGQMQEKRLRVTGQDAHDVIMSSKGEAETFESAAAHVNLRSKRFFFPNRDAYVASTTVTSLSISTTTTTVTANPTAANGLLCLPNGYRVC